MNCTLIKNYSDPKVLNKSIATITTKSCILKQDTSIQRPTIILQTDDNTLKGCNYFYLDETERYYYIEDTTLLTGGRWQISGRVDVLMSFKSEIKNIVAVIDKQSSIANASMFIDDGDFVLENRKFNEIINFPNSLLSTGEFILITAGGQGT